MSSEPEGEQLKDENLVGEQHTRLGGGGQALRCDPTVLNFCCTKMKATMRKLREHAIGASMFPPTTLRRAIERLGFVQADPIRSPARAQDLILRHRVKSYRAGDLERLYPKLEIEEDFLYAYGFVPQSTWRLLHPRLDRDLTGGEQEVLEIVTRHKRIHPRELEAFLGKDREENAWGGYSKATTRRLHALHYGGFLRVAGRENGIRLYEATAKRHDAADGAERLRLLVLLLARILQPIPESSLRAALRHLAHAAPGLAGRNQAVARLLDTGDLASAEVEGIRYVWPANTLRRAPGEHAVRFLAPFDPLVWDRRRFEHLWGWPYRFEAYTPPPKRKLGYYAMPVLWKDDIPAWVNIHRKAGKFSVELGWAKEKRTDTSFRAGFEEEVERFRSFLKVEE